MNYIRQFSATEKAIFGVLAVAAIVSAIIMARQANAYFLTEVPAYGGDLREGVVGLPRTANPVLAGSDVDRDLTALVYSGLMRYDDGDIVTDLADSYEVSEDGLTYTFKLKPDLHFQDGSPLTVDDVAFTIQKIQDPALKSPRRADWADVSVKAVSPDEIDFHLKQAYAPFLSNTTVGIIPKHIWESVSDDQFIFSQYNTEPVGAGPYMIGSVDRDKGGIPTSYKLSAWSGYKDKEPMIASITLSFFSDEEKALEALNSGSIDSLPSISPADAKRLASDSAEAYTVISSPLPRIFGVFINQNQALALADKAARQALNISVDRQTIVKDVLDGYGTSIYGPLPPVPGEKSAGTSTADIALAQAILEKSGWKKNASTGIYEKRGAKSSVQTLSFDIYTADAPDLKQAADMLKSYWTELGAEVGIKVFEPSDLYQNVIRARKYDVLLFGVMIGKDRDIYAFWHSSQRNAPGLNVAMYTNSKADKLLEDIRSTEDEAARAAKYSAFEDVIAADVPAIFLYAPDFIYAVPKSLRGVDLGSVTMPSDRFNSVSNWYTQTEKVWKIFAHN